MLFTENRPIRILGVIDGIYVTTKYHTTSRSLFCFIVGPYQIYYCLASSNTLSHTPVIVWLTMTFRVSVAVFSKAPPENANPVKMGAPAPAPVTVIHPCEIAALLKSPAAY